MKSGSSCIDAGNNAYVDGTKKEEGFALVETDLDGKYRIRQGKADSSEKVDIGAYEYVNADYPMTITVTITGDVIDPTDGEISLREAIQYVADGDMIVFDSKLQGGTIELTDQGQLEIAKSLTIDASDLYDSKTGTPGITIDGGESMRIFEVAAGKEVTISALTLQKGKADYGGAIKNNGTLTLTDMVATGNVATKNGGVVFNAEDATLTLVGGTYGDENGENSAHNGGAFANYGKMNISGGTEETPTLICYNKAARFGGAYFGCGTLKVDDYAEFGTNSAGSEGGAIYNDVRKDADGNVVSSGNVSITGKASFINNTAVDRGGAIMSYSTFEVSGGAGFRDNNGGKYGGAIDVGTNGAATLGGTVEFIANTAEYGGAIFSTGSLTFLSECEYYGFAGNTADSGGAIDAGDGTLNLAGTFMFYGNKAEGDYAKDQSGLGGAIATAAKTTVAEGTSFDWDLQGQEECGLNSAAYGACVAIDTEKAELDPNNPVLNPEKFGLKDAPANSYATFTVIRTAAASPAAAMIPQMIAASAVEATITVDGVSTTFGEEGVTPEALGLGVGTHNALVQYTDENGGTSAIYSLELTVAEGAAIDVCETTIADGRGVKFDFNLTKADGRAVSIWEISWGDGTTTRSENLSNSLMAAHYYAQDGTFDVALKVTYLDGTSETFEAFATRTVGTPLATTALDAAFADVDELFVELESPLVYGPAILR